MECKTILVSIVIFSLILGMETALSAEYVDKWPDHEPIPEITEGAYSGMLGPHDQDLMKICLDGGDILKVTAIPHGPLDIRVGVLKTLGTRLQYAQDMGMGKAEVVRYEVIVPGCYIIRVWGEGNTRGRWNLTVEVIKSAGGSTTTNQRKATTESKEAEKSISEFEDVTEEVEEELIEPEVAVDEELVEEIIDDMEEQKTEESGYFISTSTIREEDSGSHGLIGNVVGFSGDAGNIKYLPYVIFPILGLIVLSVLIFMAHRRGKSHIEKKTQFCPYCGSEINSTWNFCDRCGKGVD